MNLLKVRNFHKVIIVLLLCLIVAGFTFLNLTQQAQAQTQDSLEIYIFHGDGCPHCAKELEFLQILKNEYQDKLTIYTFEVYYNKTNGILFNETRDTLRVETAGVPLLIIGEKSIVGYGNDNTTGVDIRNSIEACIENECANPLADMMHSQDSLTQIKSTVGTSDLPPKEHSEGLQTNTENLITVPLIGNIDLTAMSLPIATFIIAFMDGFNPCAMWILIFLITMLINMKDKKRLYILGTVFILTSGLIYFIFLAAWFNFFKYIGYVYWIKVVIGLVAITSGILHLKNALFSKGECHATDEKKRESIIERIKNVTSEQKFGLAILGIITLAVSVNLIEVVCSAGLPSVYTALLASADLSIGQYYLYLLFYVSIFMLDDLIIFFLAIKTFEVTGITGKYTKWSSIIGGILIILIGLLLIFKPDLLMFG